MEEREKIENDERTDEACSSRQDRRIDHRRVPIPVLLRRPHRVVIEDFPAQVLLQLPNEG
jgi:hypothetical protein